MNGSMQEIYIQLWNEYVQAVRNYCYTKLRGRPEDAEDMLQETFGLLWKKLITDGVPPNPHAWLLQTAKNLARSEYRHTSKDRQNLSAAPIDETVTASRYVEDIAETLERQEHNARILKILDEDFTREEKQIIIYDKVDGIPQAKIAELMNKSSVSTRVRIHRLNQRLNQIKQEKI